MSKRLFACNDVVLLKLSVRFMVFLPTPHTTRSNMSLLPCVLVTFSISVFLFCIYKGKLQTSKDFKGAQVGHFTSLLKLIITIYTLMHDRNSFRDGFFNYQLTNV